jgi:iron complex transport system substrate-binding protein
MRSRSRRRSIRLQLPGILFLLSAIPSGLTAEIRLDQPDGSVLTLEAPAKSLVSLSPHLTELVFAAGAGDQLIATVEYSEFPDAAIEIPRIGDAFRLDIERIVSLHADLVLAWDSGNPGQAIQQLKLLGVPVWSVEIREPAEIADTLQALGTAVGRADTARREAEKIRERLAQLSRRYQGAESLNYFYQVDAKPLFTINGDHLISKGLDLCGGRNVFGEEPGFAFQVGYESVIVSNPDAIFAPQPEGEADPLAGWRQWQGMRAVQQDALFLLPADPISRATPRFLDSLELACKLLHRLRERGTNG